MFGLYFPLTFQKQLEIKGAALRYVFIFPNQFHFILGYTCTHSELKPNPACSAMLYKPNRSITISKPPLKFLFLYPLLPQDIATANPALPFPVAAHRPQSVTLRKVMQEGKCRVVIMLSLVYGF